MTGLLLLAAMVAAAGLGTMLVRRVRDRIRLSRRLAPLAGVADPIGEEAEFVRETPVDDITAGNGVSRWLDQRYPLAGGQRTGTIAAAASLIAALLLFPALLFVSAGVVVGAAVAIGGAVAAAAVTGNVRETRVRQAYLERLLVALEDFGRMVRFGIGPGQALTSVASSAAEPVRSSLRLVTVQMGFGVPMAVALSDEARRIRIGQLAMFSAIIATQSRTGGGLAEAVNNVTNMLRERIDAQARTVAETAESRISLIILSLVPVAALALMSATQGDVVMKLFGESRHLLGIGVGLILLGLFVAWLIVRSVRS